MIFRRYNWPRLSYNCNQSADYTLRNKFYTTTLPCPFRVTMLAWSILFPVQKHAISVCELGARERTDGRVTGLPSGEAASTMIFRNLFPMGTMIPFVEVSYASHSVTPHRNPSHSYFFISFILFFFFKSSWKRSPYSSLEISLSVSAKIYKPG